MEHSCVPLVTHGVRPRKIPQEKEICASLERPLEGATGGYERLRKGRRATRDVDLDSRNHGD
jgi:hypothetical protein